MIAHSLNVNDNVGRKCFDQYAFEKGDHRRKWKADHPIWKALFAVILVTFGVVALPGSASAELPAESSWRVYLEPTFMRPPASGPLANAQRTLLAAGFLNDSGIETCSKEEAYKLQLDWPAFVKRALINSDADLQELSISYTRDRKKVIDSAEVRSKRGLIPSAVLSSKFLGLFQDTLGPSILVAVPCREVAFAFPKLANHMEDYAQTVLRAYRDSAHPVSLEIFEIDANGMKAVGLFPDPAHD